MKALTIQGTTVPFGVIPEKPPTTRFTDTNHNAVHKLLDNYFKTKGNFNNLINNPALKQTFIRHDLQASNSDDPIELISEKLYLYMRTKQNNANHYADDILKDTTAIADIKKIWGAIMVKTAFETNPSDWEDTSDTDNFGTGSDFDNIYKITSKIFGTSDRWITSDIRFWHGRTNYTQLLQFDAVVQNFCAEKMATVNKKEQELKNELTILSSAQEELTGLRRYPVDTSNA